uniref:Uncharacterized protein n=2 Tax=unclassified Caudoviricetes TaxID=2788787 RepID=A0AAU8GCE5_9CAUD
MKLELFKFCESLDKFTRSELESFICSCRNCERAASAVGVGKDEFAIGISREFIARSMSCGYLDGMNLVYWLNDARKKPRLMKFHASKADDYFNDMVSIESLNDDDLFGEPLVRGSAESTNELLKLKTILYQKTGNQKYALRAERERLGLV